MSTTHPQNLSLELKIFSLVLALVGSVACGKNGDSAAAKKLSIENTFQRQSNVTVGDPETEPMVAAVKADWSRYGMVSNTVGVNPASFGDGSSSGATYWDNKLASSDDKAKKLAAQPKSRLASQLASGLASDVGGRAVDGHSPISTAAEKLSPSRNFTSIWVQVFPTLNSAKALADFQRRMPNDPYRITKDIGSLKIKADQGLRVLRIKDHALLAEGQTAQFLINGADEKETLTVDQNIFSLEDVYVVPKTDEPTTLHWDKNTEFSYRGSFVITRESSPSGRPCLRAVNVVSVEDYLKAVVPAEMPSTYSAEALKAQAVAARTYALYRTLFNRCDMDHHTQKCRRETPNPFDVFANTQDQLYVGVAKETDRTNAAVDKTVGIVATYNGEIIQAFFHANSGGRTCSYHDCYGGQNVAYLQSVGEPDAEAVRNISGGRSVQNISAKNFANALKSCRVKIEPTESFHLVFTKYNTSDRVIEAEIETPDDFAVLSTDDLKCVRQWLDIPSAYFEKTAASSKGNLTITSLGFGHGVGLSQEGARVQASRGQGYENILKFYYHNIKLADLRSL